VGALHLLRFFAANHQLTLNSAETRCLLSDACVLEGRPLVSGSALRWEGQITVYNCGQGPCFRCLTPVLPPAEAVGSCADSGVIGAVVGAVGCLQAVEAVKILMGRSVLEGSGGILCARMIMYDGLSGSTRNIKLRGRQATCSVCSLASHTHADLAQLSEAYKSAGCLCSSRPVVPTVTCSEFAAAAVAGKVVVIDVRRSIHTEIVSLSNAIHLPLKQLRCASGVDAVLAAACQAGAQVLDVYVNAFKNPSFFSILILIHLHRMQVHYLPSRRRVCGCRRLFAREHAAPPPSFFNCWWSQCLVLICKCLLPIVLTCVWMALFTTRAF
jgi:hypothetical protein